MKPNLLATAQLVTEVAERFRDDPIVHVAHMRMPLAFIKGMPVSSTLRQVNPDLTLADFLTDKVKEHLDRLKLEGYAVKQYILGIHAVYDETPALPHMVAFGRNVVYPHHPLAANDARRS